MTDAPDDMFEDTPCHEEEPENPVAPDRLVALVADHYRQQVALRDEHAAELLTAPVARLKDRLDEVLDVDGNPDRTPAEALDSLKDAVEGFNAETRGWDTDGWD